MKIVLMVTDGVGVRNFLLTQFLRQMTENGEVVVLHPIPEHLLPLYSSSYDGKVQWHSLRVMKETPLLFILRYALLYAQMYWADTYAMRCNRTRPIKGSWRTKIKYRFAQFLGRISASPKGMRRLGKWYYRVVERRAEVAYYRQLFQEFKPSVLFCSNQKSPSTVPAVLAARSLGIPTATFIFSWDNLTTKGRIAAPFDYYLVWSELMREELLHYYPDISPEQVYIVGTPQFDPYGDESLLWSRHEFFRRISADPERPLICYSGGTPDVVPEDPNYAEILMSLIRTGKIKFSPQVLLRPAPTDDGSRYREVLQKYSEVIYAPPSWLHTQPGVWTQVIPTPEDVQFLANLTYYADLNINVASTMTLDFAIHDKPVVNIAFDVHNPPIFGVPLWNYYYQFEHYRPVVEIGAARIARSPDELCQHVNAYLEDPSLDREKRKRLVELEVGRPIGKASEFVLNALYEISCKGVR